MASVDFGRREIRVDRERAVQRRREPIEHVERRVRIRVRPVAAAAAHERFLIADRERRHDVESHALVHALHAGGEPEDARVVGAIARHPRHLLAAPADAAAEVETPVRGRSVERQCLERNRHLGDPARLVDGRGRVPDDRPVALERVDVRVERVVAHAVGVRLEAITAAARVERVEDHHEPIVGPQPLAVPVRRRRDQRRLAVVHACAYIEGVVVVEDIDLGRLGRRRAVAGSYLMEVGDDVGRLPNRFVELAVDDGRRRGSDHADRLASVGGGCGALRAGVGAE